MGKKRVATRFNSSPSRANAKFGPLQVEVRGNDIVHALKILKNRIKTEGNTHQIFRKRVFQTRNEKRRISKKSSIRRIARKG